MSHFNHEEATKAKGRANRALNIAKGLLALAQSCALAAREGEESAVIEIVEQGGLVAYYKATTKGENVARMFDQLPDLIRKAIATVETLGNAHRVSIAGSLGNAAVTIGQRADWLANAIAAKRNGEEAQTAYDEAQATWAQAVESLTTREGLQVENGLTVGSPEWYEANHASA